MTVQNELFKIEWSEFHYHLFSYLMSAECPRELAEGLDLQLFPCSPEPNKEKMDACVQACIDSEDSVDLQDKLTHLLAGWKLAEAFNLREIMEKGGTPLVIREAENALGHSPRVDDKENN